MPRERQKGGGGKGPRRASPAPAAKEAKAERANDSVLEEAQGAVIQALAMESRCYHAEAGGECI